MGDHQAGQAPLRHDLLRQRQHLLRRGGVERRGVFVQQQQLRLGNGGHQQRGRLPLAAGEQPHPGLEPVLQPQVQLLQQIPEMGAVPSVDREEAAAGLARVRQRQVLLDGHVRRGAPQGILVQAADVQRALVVPLPGDVLAVQQDLSPVQPEFPQYGVEQRRFSRAVGAQHGDEIAPGDLEVHAAERDLLVGRAALKGLFHADEFESLHSASSSLSARRWAASRRRRGMVRAITTMTALSSFTA